MTDTPTEPDTEPDQDDDDPKPVPPITTANVAPILLPPTIT